MEIVLAAVVFVFGAVFGSFACCQAWRAHLAERGGRGVRGVAMARSKWSVCMECGYRLRWYDNIPIVSWLWLLGRCRKCGKKIGWWEILSEVGMGVVFLGFGWWFYGDGLGLVGGELVRWWVNSGLVFLMLVGFATLFISDARWGRLPVAYLVFCVACAVCYVVVREWGQFDLDRLWGYLGAVAVLPALYYLLYRISNEQWVGSGDWLLALPIALVLGEIWLAFLCLFVANMLGTLVMLPAALVRSKKVGARVPFGPFLIVAFLVVFLGQEWLAGLI